MPAKSRYWLATLPYFPPDLSVSGSFQIPYRIVRGSSVLSNYSVPLTHHTYGAAFISGALGEKRWASKEFVEADPLDAVRKFFDSVGGLWNQFSSSQVTEDNLKVKTPEGLTIALCDMLATGAFVANLPSNHPAFFVLVAVALLAKLRNPDSNPAKVSRDFVRSYAVSFVKEGFGRVTGFGGGPLTKTDLRRLVMKSVVQHCSGFVSISEENQAEALREWERGSSTEKPPQIPLALPDTCQVHEFTAHCDAVFRDLATILKAAS